MATLAERLVQAETAYHNLLIGQSAREVVDSDGSRVTYTATNMAALAAYISKLKLEIAGTPTSRGPLGVWF